MFYQHYLGNNKPNFLACNSEQVYATILEFSKIKTTLAGFFRFLEISLTWFLYGYKMRKSEVKIERQEGK